MIGDRGAHHPADPNDAAAWWLARSRLGLLSTRDQQALDAWLADPENAAAWERTARPIEAMAEVAAHPQILALRAEALAAHPAPAARTWHRAAWAALAASLIAILGWTLLPGAPMPGGTAADAAHAAPLRYATKTGERRTVRLADGSRIELNTGSVLEVSYSAGRRDVRLLGGQAMFHVAKDQDRPFVVAAGDRRITATGTAFDVRLGDKGVVSVLLVEGRVRVDPVKREGFARLVPAIVSETLDPGQRLTAPVSGEVRIAAADVDRSTSWTRGQLIFRDDRLGDAVEEMNRYSRVRLVIEDPRVAALKVSGVFRAERSDNFVTALTAFYPIEAERRSPGIVALEWRD
jgi:transmembrane sensor